MTASEVVDFWTLKRAALRANLASEPVESFLSWPTIDGTMFVGETDYLQAERAELTAAFESGWLASLGPEWGGRPDTNLVHQAYHLWQWQRHTGRRVADLARIVEIGGGYGALARVCYAAGFRGEYTIYDLPELCVLQRFYLAQWSVPAVCRSEFDGDAPDLVIGIYSLSEMLIAEARRYLDGLTSEHFLIGVQDGPWEGDYTARILEEHYRHGRRVEHPHLPGRYYLMGAVSE